MNAPGPVPPAVPPALTADAIVRLYHARSKHRFEAYAAGPKMLDWDAQPAPFRRYEGAPVVTLPLIEEIGADDPLAQVRTIRFDHLHLPQRPQAAGLASIGVLLQLALGITAWKALGPERWAVRANPSSGNLHPVEAWLITRGVPGLADGVHHYRADDHALECRAADAPPSSSSFKSSPPPSTAPQLRIALSSAMWREAWKYGERGFRYCQLDVGHTIGALAHAATVLGWALAECPIGHQALAQRLGLDRAADYPNGQFPDLEREEAEILLTVDLDGLPTTPSADEALLGTAVAHWHGKASRLDPAPRQHWPLINDIATATRRAPSDCASTGRAGHATAHAHLPVLPNTAAMPRSAVDILLTRRSAQRFAARHWMTRPQFLALVQVLHAQDSAGLAPAAPRLHPVLFIHRVETLEPGLYTLASSADSAWIAPFAAGGEPVAGFDEPFWLRLLRRFEAVEQLRLARSLHCHQDIAASACLALGLVAPFAPVIARDPPAYRDLLRTAGLIGHALYLTAEALGLRATGIGCYFDDPVHTLLGLAGDDYQTLYHFTVGLPIDDPRIETGAAYPARHPPPATSVAEPPP